jgi:phosphopantetheinyl transferase (holo-ACP synthase)
MAKLLGIGVDVTSVTRIARVRSRRDLMREVCAEDELMLFPLTDLDAARLWAGKEAIVKTLGTGFWQRGVDWTDIRFTETWTATLHGRARDYAGASTVEVSFESRGDFVIATSRRWDLSVAGQ